MTPPRPSRRRREKRLIPQEIQNITTGVEDARRTARACRRWDLREAPPALDQGVRGLSVEGCWTISRVLTGRSLGIGRGAFAAATAIDMIGAFGEG